MDLRDIEDGEMPHIYCMLVLQIQGKTIGDCEAFQGSYEDGTWDLDWGTY
jgi:hypothetical protein